MPRTNQVTGRSDAGRAKRKRTASPAAKVKRSFKKKQRNGKNNANLEVNDKMSSKSQAEFLKDRDQETPKTVNKMGQSDKFLLAANENKGTFSPEKVSATEPSNPTSEVEQEDKNNQAFGSKTGIEGDDAESHILALIESASLNTRTILWRI